MRNIINLSSRYADAMDNIRKPVQLRKIIPSNSIVLFMHTLPDFLQDPIRISPNEYALFASSKGNERFAAIILYYPHRNKENESWYIHGDVITDDYGVRFERLKGLQLKDYLVYIREDLATK